MILCSNFIDTDDQWKGTRSVCFTSLNNLILFIVFHCFSLFYIALAIDFWSSGVIRKKIFSSQERCHSFIRGVDIELSPPLSITLRGNLFFTLLLTDISFDAPSLGRRKGVHTSMTRCHPQAWKLSARRASCCKTNAKLQWCITFKSPHRWPLKEGRSAEKDLEVCRCTLIEQLPHLFYFRIYPLMFIMSAYLPSPLCIESTLAYTMFPLNTHIYPFKNFLFEWQ